MTSGRIGESAEQLVISRVGKPFGIGDTHRTVAIAIAVLWVFSWTWLAHSWQTFWLIGIFPVHPIELVMWFVVGREDFLSSLRHCLSGAGISGTICVW